MSTDEKFMSTDGSAVAVIPVCFDGKKSQLVILTVHCDRFVLTGSCWFGLDIYPVYLMKVLDFSICSFFSS